MTIITYIIGAGIILSMSVICGTIYAYWRVYVKGCEHNTSNAFEHA